jgi:hypothetical protein
MFAPLAAETATGALIFDDVAQETLLLDATSLTPVVGASLPAATWQAAMTWDEGRDQVVVYGVGAGRDELWTFDGVAWTARAPAGPTPGVRVDAGIAYDRVRDVVVLFGGGSAETWEWDGVAWTLADTEGPVDQVVGPRLAWDDELDAVVLFGGARPGWIASPKVWRWDGASWSPITTANAPLGRAMHGLLVDEREGMLVAQSGFWELFLDSMVADTSLLPLSARAHSVRFDVRLDAARAEGATLTGAALRVRAETSPQAPLTAAAFANRRAIGWRTLGPIAPDSADPIELDAPLANELISFDAPSASFLVSAAATQVDVPSAMTVHAAELQVRYRFPAIP